MLACTIRKGSAGLWLTLSSSFGSFCVELSVGRKLTKGNNVKKKMALMIAIVVLASALLALGPQPPPPILLFENSGDLALRQSDILSFDGEAVRPLQFGVDGYEYQSTVTHQGEVIYVRNSAQFDTGPDRLVETAIMRGGQVLLESTEVTPRWYLPRLSPAGNLLAVIGEERTTPEDTLIFDQTIQQGSDLLQALSGGGDNQAVVAAAAELFGVQIRDKHIYVLNMETHDLVRLPRPAGSYWGYTPVWIDDTRLMYVVDSTYVGNTESHIVLVSGIGTSAMRAEILAQGSDPDVYGNLLLFRRDDRTYRLDLQDPAKEAIPLIDGVCGRWAIDGSFYTVVFRGNVYAVRTDQHDGNNPVPLTTHAAVIYTEDELVCPEPAVDRLAYVTGTRWNELMLHVLTLEVTETEVLPLNDTMITMSVYGPLTWAIDGISLP